MKGVVIGAGRIGCGFVAERLRASGHDVVVAGRGPRLERLAATGRCTVRLVGPGGTEERILDRIGAVDVGDHRRMERVLAEADLIATAVGAGNLDAVARMLAAGLAGRRHGVNVIAFENVADVAAALRAGVARALPDHRWRDDWGCSGAVVSRVVARGMLPDDPSAPPRFVGDPSTVFQVDAGALCGDVPAIDGMQCVDDYQAWLQRKLYTYSAGHAATAYLGHLKGYHYIHSAIRDPEIRAAVLAAMTEGQRGLAARYGPDLAGDRGDLEAILTRFDNAALNDRISRVARDPRRKLSGDDRLVGAARLAADAGAQPERLLLAAAAAFCFTESSDPRAVEFHNEVERGGAESLIATVCKLEPTRGLGRTVATRWRELAAGWSAGNLLLDLATPQWAWSGR